MGAATERQSARVAENRVVSERIRVKESARWSKKKEKKKERVNERMET